MKMLRKIIVIYLRIGKSYTIYLKLLSRLPNSQITATEKTRFFFKLLLILPIHKLATKSDTLFVKNSSIKAKAPQVDQFVCTPNVTKSFKIDNFKNYST